MKKFTIERTTFEGAITYVEVCDLRTGEIFEGYATCSDADEFDLRIGQQLAYQRACIKANKAYADYLEAKANRLNEEIERLTEERNDCIVESDNELMESICRQEKVFDIIGD